ncbi:hypothetical protein BN7_4099 [Wickerhamomyces ciferrii]|uniref:UBA domain-containing protein n=1 Tax=Wickerhamomyces ciferrii (strain ATCC 14091 / BCRC 22168 / CBS 111 / JCM 3599 / NBRC 0793 / NRRL Y-1031 F-60-10) TaxID=1206466 RepID=K0KTA4_WICCF|nr:uncharacterized protein BN7_4099 [Wickerhamomyces ciferrii]CCH44533.1 hypothetical protein BN7_4099 [Wickerhamomyces ciferrii]
MSKRNQKRIEHELKDLINERSNSNKCGECGAGFPSIEIYQYLRQKYLQGKFRHDPIDEQDYNLGGSSSRPRSRARSISRPSSRPSTSSRNIPKLSHRDISEYDRLKYRKQEQKLEDQGFSNVDDNYESLYLAKGDFNLAIDILQNSGPSVTNSRDEGPKPALPRRPGTSVSSTGGGPSQSISQPATASSDWWSGNNNGSTTQQQIATPAIFDGTSSSQLQSQQTTGIIEPPQQYLDPQTGIIYVDPIQQQQYLQQQQQLQLQQNPTGFYQQQSQQFPQQTGFQQPQQTGIFNQQQQPFQTGGVAPQRTGIDKNQLLSLYNTGSQQQQQQQQQTGFSQGFPQQPQQTGFQQQPQQGYQFGGFNGYNYQ